MWVFVFGGHTSTGLPAGLRGETLTFDHKFVNWPWHLPPLLTMFNVYLFIPYLGNIYIYIIPVDQYCSEGLKVSKHFSTPPTPPRQKKGEPKTKLPEIYRNIVKDLIEVDPKKKTLEVWLWTNKKQMVPCGTKSKLSSWGTWFFFMFFFVAGPNQKNSKIYCFLQLWVAPFPSGGVYIHWGVINEDGEALHCDGRCPVDLKGVRRGSWGAAWEVASGHGSYANKTEPWHIKANLFTYITPFWPFFMSKS